MSRKTRIVGFIILIVLLASVTGFATRGRWWPIARAKILIAFGAVPASGTEYASDHEAHDEHAGHDHGGHSEVNSIEMSKQAQANIGIKFGKVELTTFERKITIPGMIQKRPGRSTVEITAPLTGIVTRIHPIEGEAVEGGQKLFDLRLTHEELVQAQGDFLRTAEELDVIQREIQRLEKIAAEGGIPGRQVLERQYEQQTKQAVLRAQYQALLLHGLSEAQVKQIQATRTLFQNVTVAVPDEHAEHSDGKPASPILYQIQKLTVERGQSVEAGQTLAVLTDQAELFIEGNAFDKDAVAVTRAVDQGWKVDAVLETDDAQPHVVRGLKILYAAGEVDPETRTFHFYLTLFNERSRDMKVIDGHRFISWRYKPGQRVQLMVSVEQWTDRIVLPVDAVAQEGAETYVFSPNSDHFDRRPVHVEYRDRFSVVIANDGSIYPSDEVVLSGAQQMQLALKNKSGGAPDPHAGHNH